MNVWDVRVLSESEFATLFQEMKAEEAAQEGPLSEAFLEKWDGFLGALAQAQGNQF